LIDAVVKANPHTVVVLNVGAPVTMPWVEQTPAVLNAWFPGEEGGHAIADILFGDVNPSGRLPETFPRRLEDSPSWGHYPGKDGVVDYADGIYVGYRHFDKQNIDPLFCFGHGLSYTKFEYTDLKVSPQEVTLKVRNTGSRDGAEVVQLYIQPLAPSIDRPVKELKAFRRIDLKHGETSTVTLTLDDRSLAYFDPAKKTWVTDPGKYEVLVGSSSRDIRLKGTVTR
jgi:beta-glucosidase